MRVKSLNRGPGLEYTDYYLDKKRKEEEAAKGITTEKTEEAAKGTTAEKTEAAPVEVQEQPQTSEITA